MFDPEKRRAEIIGVMLIAAWVLAMLSVALFEAILGQKAASAWIQPLAGSLMMLAGIYQVRFRHALGRMYAEDLQRNWVSRIFYFPGKYHPAMQVVSGVLFIGFGLMLWASIIMG